MLTMAKQQHDKTARDQGLLIEERKGKNKNQDISDKDEAYEKGKGICLG